MVLNNNKPTILMSPPTFFTVDYAINPWMSVDQPADLGLAQQQWDNLKKAITDGAGAEVVLMDPAEGLPDLVFTANAGFVYKDTAIVANYKYPERQPEEPLAAQWFFDNGFRTVRLPKGIFFEGAGDALIWKDRVFAGYRTRTDIASHNLITAETGLPVMSLELKDPRFYHIDVCICPLEDGQFIYFPGAFDSYGNAVIEANIPKDNLIPVEDAEACQFACNAVNVGNTVILNSKAPKLIAELERRGINVIPVEMGEFIKSGGSAKCCTLRVK